MIFLSYSREDKDEVLLFKSLLEKSGVAPVWIDQERIHGGSKWRETIAENIEQSKVVLLCASPHSVNSEIVQEEVSYAKRHGVPVFFVFLRPIEKVILPRMLDMMFGNDDFKVWDPRESADRIPFSIFRTLKEKYGISSSDYQAFESTRSSRDREIIRKIEMLPDLIDRIGQTRVCERFVLQRFRSTESGPQVILLHGKKNQLVPEFRRALVDYRIKKLISEEGIDCRMPPEIIPIPITESELQNRDPEDITYAMADRSLSIERSSTKEDIARYFKGNANLFHTMVFHFTIDGKAVRVLKRYIDIFFDYWKSFPDVGEARVMIILAISSDCDSPKNSKVCQHLMRWSAGRHFPAEHGCALPRLEDIPSDDAALWVEENAVADLLESLDLQTVTARDMIRKIYTQTSQDRLPMSRLAPRVREALFDRLYKRLP